VALAAVSAVAERRRVNRHDLDRVGVIDWRTVQLAALAGLVLLAYVWLKA
jgi:hypothetical protein